jgi:hypothetical protein
VRSRNRLWRKGLDSLHGVVYILYMTQTQNPKGSENWTEKQIKAYAMLRASFAANEARRLNQPSILNKAPKDGWTTSDRINK